MMPDNEYHLGRLPEQDARDEGFLAKALLPERAQLEFLTGYKYWSSVHWNDQGSSGMCVGFNSINWWEDGPITHPRIELDPVEFYKDACLKDGWPANDNGDPDFGTSIHAAAKVMKDRKWVDTYLWGQDIITIVNWIRTKGPVLVGTTWYNSMFDTEYKDDGSGTKREMLVINEADGVAGGHCWIWDGVNIEKRVIRGKLGSWTRTFGDDGYCWMTFDTAERLMEEDSEMMMAAEVVV